MLQLRRIWLRIFCAISNSEPILIAIAAVSVGGAIGLVGAAVGRHRGFSRKTRTLVAEEEFACRHGPLGSLRVVSRDLNSQFHRLSRILPVQPLGIAHVRK